MAFHEELPAHALSLGADLVISSTHKIVGSLTQSAMLHLGERGAERIGEDAVDRAVTLTESTSPSSLLTASLDAARRLAVPARTRAARADDADARRHARADPRDRRPRRARRAHGRARGRVRLRPAAPRRRRARDRRDRLRAGADAARDRRHQPRAVRAERRRGRVRDGRARAARGRAARQRACARPPSASAWIRPGRARASPRRRRGASWR